MIKEISQMQRGIDSLPIYKGRIVRIEWNSGRKIAKDALA
jgi:hypothetical protein